MIEWYRVHIGYFISHTDHSFHSSPASSYIIYSNIYIYTSAYLQSRGKLSNKIFSTLVISFLYEWQSKSFFFGRVSSTFPWYPRFSAFYFFWSWSFLSLYNRGTGTLPGKSHLLPFIVLFYPRIGVRPYNVCRFSMSRWLPAQQGMPSYLCHPHKRPSSIFLILQIFYSPLEENFFSYKIGFLKKKIEGLFERSHMFLIG